MLELSALLLVILCSFLSISRMTTMLTCMMAAPLITKANPHEIMAVKKNIEDIQGKDNYPCGQQLLIHNRKVLKDESSLAENNISEDGFLVVMLSKACNAHGLHCVPLYDTLGASAVEFVIFHDEVSIVFAEEKKIHEVFKTFPKTTEYIKTIVSFGEVTPEQREEAEKLGLEIYSWDEFLLLGDDKHFELPVKKKSDICTIMYTSGTTGDPKGVLISNNSIVTIIAAVKRFLQGVNEPLTVNNVYLSYLLLAHIFDRVIEECFISHGAQIGFWRGDVKLLVEDIGVLKPTVLCAVPRVLDRIYSANYLA